MIAASHGSSVGLRRDPFYRLSAKAMFWEGRMRTWFGIVAAAVVLAGAPAAASAQARLFFDHGSPALTEATRAQLEAWRPQILEMREIVFVGHADPGEAQAAAEMVAAYRAGEIERMVIGEEYEARLGVSDDFFAPESDQMTAEGAELLDRIIERLLEGRRFLTFSQPEYGAGDLETRRAAALAQALISRGAQTLADDGSAFMPGSLEPVEGARERFESTRRTYTGKLLVIQAGPTNPAEGEAALTTLALQRAENLRAWIASFGHPFGLMTVQSAGAADPAPSPEQNRWADIQVGQPSGW
jgi:hypothetical protein